MPNIHFEMFPGRTADHKPDLARELTNGFVRTCSGPGDRLQVVITEVERENRGVGGELMANK
ncbi:MAG: tautomerase family protein [Acidimicrobiales bacterium]|jgi:4-oxalocrotonate tautomerase|nr:tautomerase family protein [Acidimicrobiales bacterium]